MQKLITLRGEKEHTETQVNRLQHKVKDLGEDFRARLVKYVEDIAVSWEICLKVLMALTIC